MSQQSQNRKTSKNRRTSVAFAVLTAFCLGSAAPPAGSAAELAAGIPIDINSESSTDTISMSFDGALLKDVLLLFSQQSGLNFVASSEVESKKVTVYFENVTPKDALDAIVSANGLAYSKKQGSDIFMVYPASKTQVSELVTKVIRLKYMRLSNSPLDVGGQVTISDLQKSSAPDSSASSGGASGSSSSTESSGGSSSTSSGSARGADKLIERLLTSQGKLTTDLNTNSIIITDTKESIAAIEKILAEVDVPPSQVILEVYIMEVSKTVASDVGIAWGGASGAMGTLRGGARTTTFPLRPIGEPDVITGAITGDIGGDDGTFISPGSSFAESTLQYGLIDASAFAATLHFIQSHSKTKILARPRVLTQNNEAAQIKLVTNAAIGSNTVTSGEGAAAQSSEEAERSEVGITMRMTPQINPDDTVAIFLEPSVTTIADSRLGAATQDTTTRLVRTMARIKDNQTLVIGGLIDGQDTTAKRKIPFLGDLPGIGKAFRYDSVDDTDRELLVFVTPHIVRGMTSLGLRSATARGEDTAVRRMLDEFIDKEMDLLGGTFQNFEKTKAKFFTREEELVRESERRYSNPVVEKQMNQALDALSPQMVEHKMTQTLDSLNPKK